MPPDLATLGIRTAGCFSHGGQAKLSYGGQNGRHQPRHSLFPMTPPRQPGSVRDAPPASCCLGVDDKDFLVHEVSSKIYGDKVNGTCVVGRTPLTTSTHVEEHVLWYPRVASFYTGRAVYL
ncbi:uncharacterized protein [Aegilops tauschii subsp. strangulata]|uniref:uncharacterized protein n=1 Tax=Aegilops tauschii subsp. strangulata TaxID=200361 RepID=UPI00098A3F1A|nr:uncharacterized protein LOC109771005 [Aegilops tauschii subsp. strangulata]XP_040242535.1 uncharacterized protein LOC109771005 [Aegilops tauschii subsp. strangulata]